MIKIINGVEQEVKVVNLGFGFNDDVVMELHTATCDCGCRIYRAEKESSLQSSIAKVTAKCCGSKLHYSGIQSFKGKEVITPEVVETPKEEAKAPIKSWVDVLKKHTQGKREVCNEKEMAMVVINEETGWVEPKSGKNGVTNQGIIPAIKLAYAHDNMENLKAVFTAYPELFISSCKYLKDSMKESLETVIRSNPEFVTVKIPRRKM